jgi:type I restriction enzyme R subunit
MIKELYDKIKTEQPLLAPLHVWRAYASINSAQVASPKNELTALVSMIRKVSGIDDTLTSYDKTVDKNFQDWVFKKQAGTLKYSEEQMQWLRMIKDYVANSFHVEKEDFELDPFNKVGGLGRFYQLFKEDYETILQELNEVLAA